MYFTFSESWEQIESLKQPIILFFLSKKPIFDYFFLSLCEAHFMVLVLSFAIHQNMQQIQFRYSGVVVVVVIVWYLDLQLPVQSVPITTKVVSSNPVHGEVYSIQHYMIKFVSDLRRVVGILQVLQFLPPIKLTHNITEILLKVALNTINLNPNLSQQLEPLMQQIIMFFCQKQH